MKKRFDFVIKQFGFEVDDGEQLLITGYANKYRDENGNTIVDRSGDSIPTYAYNLDNFKKNPVLLYQHNQEEIVGKVINVKLDEYGLKVEAVVKKSLNPKVYELVETGLLKAFSIGFMAKDYHYDTDKDIWYWTNIELLEVSLVAVPDNQDSLFTELVGSPCESGVCLLGVKDYNKKSLNLEDKNEKENIKKEKEMDIQKLKEEIKKELKEELKKEISEKGEVIEREDKEGVKAETEKEVINNANETDEVEKVDEMDNVEKEETQELSLTELLTKLSEKKEFSDEEINVLFEVYEKVEKALNNHLKDI